MYISGKTLTSVLLATAIVAPLGSVRPAIAQTDTGSLTDALDTIIAGYEANRTSIVSGMGQASFTWSRTHEADASPSVKEAFSKTGTEGRMVQWYFAGEKRRADTKSLPRQEGEEALTLPIDEQMAWDRNSKIYIEHRGKDRLEAYIHKAVPEDKLAVRHIGSWFDPTVFLRLDDKALTDWLADFKRLNSEIGVDRKEARVYVIHARMHWESQGKHHQSDATITVDGDQGYNVTRFATSVDGKETLNIQAEYLGNGGIFFPSKYRLRKNMNGLIDVMDVAFKNVQLNVPIDDSVFTFKGMGLPAGTPLMDMRASNPIRTTYGTMPASRLDELVARIATSQAAIQAASAVASQPSVAQGVRVDSISSVPVASAMHAPPDSHVSCIWPWLVAFVAGIPLAIGLWWKLAAANRGDGVQGDR